MNLLQAFILLSTSWTSWQQHLGERCVFLEVGYTGYVTDIDRSIAAARGLKALNRFEHWLLASIIEDERQRRRTVWHEVMRYATGE